MFNKKLEDLEYSDIQKLIDSNISESITLDYKSRFSDEDEAKYKGNSKKIYHEIAKDITGLANSDGGYLIYGIKEVDNVATEIVGIESKRGNDEICDWLNRFMTNGGVTYKVTYQTHKIKILNPDSDKIILVVEVPQSINKPHMVSFDPEIGNCYYIRSGTETKKANHNEVRHMFEFKNNYIKLFNDFIEKNNLTEESQNFGITPFSKRLTKSHGDQKAEHRLVISFIPYNLDRRINFQQDTSLNNYINKNYSLYQKVLLNLPNKALNSQGSSYVHTNFVANINGGIQQDLFYRYFHIYKNGAMEWGEELRLYDNSYNNEEKQPIGYISLIQSVAGVLCHQKGLSLNIESVEWNLRIAITNIKNMKLFMSDNIHQVNRYFEDNLLIDIDYTKEQLSKEGILDIISQVSDDLLAAFGLVCKFEQLNAKTKVGQIIEEFEKEGLL